MGDTHLQWYRAGFAALSQMRALAERLVREQERLELRPEAQAHLDRITQMDGTLAQARKLTHGFFDLMRHHSGEGLDTWLKDVRASSVRELLPFARSIEWDKAAILAGLTLPYRSGEQERGRPRGVSVLAVVMIAALLAMLLGVAFIVLTLGAFP